MQLKQILAALIVLGGATLTAACGTDAGQSTPHDGGAQSCAGPTAYFAGIAKVSPSGLSVSILDSIPAPPRAGENTWKVKLSQSDGTAIEGATINVEPWMPKHQHGSPPPCVNALGAASTS